MQYVSGVIAVNGKISFTAFSMNGESAVEFHQDKDNILGNMWRKLQKLLKRDLIFGIIGITNEKNILV